MRTLTVLLLVAAAVAAQEPDPKQSVVGVSARRQMEMGGRSFAMPLNQIGVVIAKDTVLTPNVGDNPDNLRVFRPGTSDPLDAEVISGDDAWSVLRVEGLAAPALKFKQDWSAAAGQKVHWVGLLPGGATRWTAVSKEAVVDALIEDPQGGKPMAYSDPPFRGPVGTGGALVLNARGEAVGLVVTMQREERGGQGQRRAMMRRMRGGGVPVIKSAAAFAHYLGGEIKRRGVLGITGEPLAEKVAKALGMEGTVGVLVTQVTPGSGAEDAGIRAEDVITRVDEQVTPTLVKLQQALLGKKAGDIVAVEVVRITEEGPVPEMLKVTLGARDEAGKKDRFRARRFGFVAEPLTASVRLAQALGEEVQGVHVRRVTPGSPAALARPTPLRRGDVILRIGDKEVRDIEELRKVLQRLPNGAAVTLFVRNGRDTRFVEMTPEASDD